VDDSLVKIDEIAKYLGVSKVPGTHIWGAVPAGSGLSTAIIPTAKANTACSGAGIKKAGNR